MIFSVSRDLISIFSLNLTKMGRVALGPSSGGRLRTS